MITSAGYGWEAKKLRSCSIVPGKRFSSLYAGMMMDKKGVDKDL
jgi:hypothetical protein